MKSVREQMEIVDAYETVGSYRGAAALCGTTPKTVKRVLERVRRGQVGRRPAPPRPHTTDGVQALIAERVRRSDGRISAKRLLPLAQAAGYAGSARSFRRAVARAKAEWRSRRRSYRPWTPVPGEHQHPLRGYPGLHAGGALAAVRGGAGLEPVPLRALRRGYPPGGCRRARRRWGCWRPAWRRWGACRRWC